MYDEVEELFHEDEVELDSTEEPDDGMLTLHVVDVLDSLADDNAVDIFSEIEQEEPDQEEEADEFHEEEVLVVTDAEPVAIHVAAVPESRDEDDEDADVEGELPLDAILYEQEFGTDIELDEDEPEIEPAPEHWPVAGDSVAPPGLDEFVCSECFLVKHRRQLANASAQLCADCA